MLIQSEIRFQLFICVLPFRAELNFDYGINPPQRSMYAKCILEKNLGETASFASIA